MNATVKQGSLTKTQCDALIVNLFEGIKQPGGATGAVDNALGGAISRQIEEEEFFEESEAFDAAITMPVGRPCPDTSATTTVSVRASPERS